MIRLVTVCILFISSSSCGLGINKKTKPLHQNTINFEILAQDFYGGMLDSKFIVINDQASLNEMYNLLSKGRMPELDTPKINFDRETVIALFLGEKSSGGYSIYVEKAFNSNDIVTIDYKITAPKRGEMVTTVMTQPYCIIKIPKTLNEVVFKKIDY